MRLQYEKIVRVTVDVPDGMVSTEAARQYPGSREGRAMLDHLAATKGEGLWRLVTGRGRPRGGKVLAKQKARVRAVQKRPRGRPRKKVHWTRRPENRAKAQKFAETMRQARLRQSAAAKGARGAA